ncbi:MAG: right-handed parallel beta-helix repeat-containing protein, partial [Planctomycetota bacterium]
LTGSVNPETIVMDTDKAITAHFGYTLTVNTTPMMGGSVTLEPAGGIYHIETEVTLTAQPAPTFAFDHWSGDLTGSINPTTIFIDSAKSISAHFIFGADIIYVNDDANGANNGTSWANAFTDLQDALACSTPGRQIWVAAGTYTPDPCGLTDPREASFQMNNGVGIYGGFAGDEDPNVFDLADRDFTTNESILSGDIGIPDVNTDNCYRVIYNQQGTTLDSSAVLDGFTITGGSYSGSIVLEGGMMNEGASNYPCSPTVTNCTFRDNHAQYGGGMVNINYSSPTVTNCTFSGNSSYSFDGGGMYNGDNSNPTVTNCTFRDNLASIGGGMGNINSSPTVTNCTFHDNLASSGGGMGNRTNCSPTVTNCTFRGNSATSGHGGGMYNSGGSPTVTNCTFSGNEALINGGGMHNSGSSPTVSNCIFIGNSATSTVFYSGGGGMFNEGGSPTVTNCTFSGNEASVNGGGMYNYASSPTVTNCTFSGNITGGSGGAMYNDRSSPTVTNCTFSGNEASVNGGGMYNSGDSPTVTNCTFYSNAAVNYGGGMYNEDNISPTVTNCILWGDLPDEIYNSSTSPTVTYSDVWGGWGDPNDPNNTNIDAAPRFVDPNNPDPNLCNLRLKPDSPCIDAGDTTAVPGGIWADLGGNPRVFDDTETPDTGISILGITVDIGAYEFYCSGIAGDINCDGVVDFKDVAILCGNWLAGAGPEL